MIQDSTLLVRSGMGRAMARQERLCHVVKVGVAFGSDNLIYWNLLSSVYEIDSVRQCEAQCELQIIFLVKNDWPIWKEI